MTLLFSPATRRQAQKPAKGDSGHNLSPDGHECELFIPAGANIDFEVNDGLEHENKSNQTVDRQ